MPEPQPAYQASPEAASAPESEAHESEKHVQRRSTVREKVSFATNTAPAAEPPVVAAPEPAPAPEPETSSEQPRKAGWWSRRFGSGS